jgi:DnaJ-class molecular chaperone
MSAGKGDRPRTVDKHRYDANFDRIYWRKTCPHCNGKGMVHVYEADVDDVRWDDCQFCAGEGKIKTNKGE